MKGWCIPLKKNSGIVLAGAVAGAVNGLFGAGGGMVLVPLLTLFSDFEEDEIFPTSVSIILPICFVSLWMRSMNAPLPFADALPYLLGSVVGGILAGITGNRIPIKWLHRILGILIVYGGVKYLC